MFFNLLQPVFHVFKSMFRSAVVNDDDPICPFVVLLSNGLKPFLPGSVPHLELNSLVIDRDFLDSEVDS